MLPDDPEALPPNMIGRNVAEQMTVCCSSPEKQNVHKKNNTIIVALSKNMFWKLTFPKFTILGLIPFCNISLILQSVEDN